MNKAMIVARHEFLSNVRRPAYLFASFGVPLLTIGLMILIMAIAFQAETDTSRVGQVGYVDQSGVLADAREKPDNYTAYTDETEAREALDAGEIGAFFVLPPDYLETGDVKLYSLAGLPEATTDEIDRFLVANLGVELNDPELVSRIQEPVNMVLRTLDNGRELREDSIVALILMPFLLVFVLIMASQISSSYLMSGVVEEKTNRVMEMLITSVTPFQLLLGKMLGLGALGLLQVIVWLAMGTVGLMVAQGNSLLEGISLPTDMVILSLIYFILSYMLFAGVMAGIGAVVGSEQESRQIAGFFVFVTMIPIFFIIQFFEDPNGTIPVVLTMIPLTSPVTVLLRLGLGSVPAWQLAVSIALLALTTLFAVWASARVFRWALLMYGKRPGLRDIWRAVRKAPRVAVVKQERAA